MAPLHPLWKDGNMTVRAVEFRTDYEGAKPVDYVLLAPSGEAFMKTQTWTRVDKMRPPEGLNDRDKSAPTYIAMHARWSVVGPAYEAWKQGSEVPENGTPLAAWSGVSAEQAKLLRNMGIYTVEDVRDASESAILRIPMPNARRLPQLAAEYLKGADVAAKDAEMAAMRERMDAMAEMLEAQKPKRGRPAKASEEEAA